MDFDLLWKPSLLISVFLYCSSLPGLPGRLELQVCGLPQILDLGLMLTLTHRLQCTYAIHDECTQIYVIFLDTDSDSSVR